MKADTDIMAMDFGRYFKGMDRDKERDTDIKVVVNNTETKDTTRMKSNT
jgi:hypothetical protein